jgi:asparagine synthase (glutamine-hydrolysing)
MLRFLALLWDSADSAANDHAVRLGARISTDPTWSRVLTQNGVAVFSACDARESAVSHHLLWNQAGIILGTLFEQSSDPQEEVCNRARPFSRSETELILTQGPSRLIERYWGWYVAVIRNAHDGSTWVLRSPMSDLPCLHATSGRVELCFSRVEDALSLTELQTTIDWPLIHLQVGFGEPGFMGQSAIREIAVVERGEALSIIRGRAVTRSHWDPCALARAPLPDNPAQVARALHATVKRCVHAWARDHDALLHRLSGGFDSSLLLHCLANVPTRPAITCLNYYWDGALADERVYARAIAGHARASLRELRFGTDNTLDVLRQVRRTAAPVVDVVDWQESARERAIARETGATAIFMGSLGDALFERDTCLSAAADHLRARGLHPAFFETLMNVALHARTTIWKVFYVACKEAWLRPIKGSWSIHGEMLRNGMMKHHRVLAHDDVIESLYATALSRNHKWLKNVDGVPRAKLWQISALFADSFYDRHCITDDQPPVVAAYLSQPLAELCLRIPSYLNVRAGVDRAMIREAFSHDLPDVILRRSSKGSPETWLREMIERDAQFVREFLLDGILVKERIVDREKLECALPGRISTRAAHAGGILNLLCTEAWLHAWSGTTGGRQ